MGPRKFLSKSLAPRSRCWMQEKSTTASTTSPRCAPAVWMYEVVCAASDMCDWAGERPEDADPRFDRGRPLQVSGTKRRRIDMTEKIHGHIQEALPSGMPVGICAAYRPHQTHRSSSRKKAAAIVEIEASDFYGKGQSQEPRSDHLEPLMP